MNPLTKQERWLMWSSILIGVAWIMYRLLASTGWILDDEISHYLFSKSVWENSDQIFNHWTRPGRNLLHCFAAPFGFTATRIFTLVLAMLSVWVTFKVGRILKIQLLWTVPMMLIFQSWFPELSYPVLTQTPFMLFWILGVWLALTKRWHLAGFCFGYLSLIRHEGILLTATWGLWLTFSEGGFGRQCVLALRKKVKISSLIPKLGSDALYGLSTVSAIILYNLAALLFNDSLPFSVYFESKPTTMYGSGTIYHFVPLFAAGVGGISFFLFIAGGFSIGKRMADWSILLVTYPLYFILHSLIYWKGAFASGGYYHFLMPMAPFVALLAAEGLSIVWSKNAASWRRVVGYALLLVVAYVGMNTTYHFWQGAFASGKYGHFLISVIPFVGLLAAEGLSMVWTKKAFTCRRISGYMLLVLVVFQGLNMAHHQVYYQDWAAIMAGDTKPNFQAVAKPMKKGEVNLKITEASEWAVNHYPEGTVIIAKHVTHNFTQGTLATQERVWLENSALHKMPIGTVFLWDSGYCENENRIKYSSFEESQDWKSVKSWKFDYPKEGNEMKDEFVVIIFEKVSEFDKSDKEYSELGESDKYDEAYE